MGENVPVEKSVDSQIDAEIWLEEYLDRTGMATPPDRYLMMAYDAFNAGFDKGHATAINNVMLP